MKQRISQREAPAVQPSPVVQAAAVDQPAPTVVELQEANEAVEEAPTLERVASLEEELPGEPESPDFWAADLEPSLDPSLEPTVDAPASPASDLSGAPAPSPSGAPDPSPSGAPDPVHAESQQIEPVVQRAPPVEEVVPADARVGEPELEESVMRPFSDGEVTAPAAEDEVEAPASVVAAAPEQAPPPAPDPHSGMLEATADVEAAGPAESSGPAEAAPSERELSTKAWFNKAGDVTSIMPPDVAKAYERARKQARKGQLAFPRRGTAKQTRAYNAWMRVYKKWIESEFGQTERRINKDIVEEGGRRATAVNIEGYIAGRLAPIPSEYRSRSLKLFDEAAVSFEKMAQAAEADGVDLIAQSAYRKPSRKKSSNTAAKANNSSHSYGLAVDLLLSDRDQKFKVTEISTKNANNLMKYFGSPATKWMMANGARFNWHPYTNEPWHFEYNPPGLAKRIVLESRK